MGGCCIGSFADFPELVSIMPGKYGGVFSVAVFVTGFGVWGLGLVFARRVGCVAMGMRGLLGGWG